MYFDFPLPLNSYCSQGLMEVSRYLLGYFFFFYGPSPELLTASLPVWVLLGFLPAWQVLGV